MAATDVCSEQLMREVLAELAKTNQNLAVMSSQFGDLQKTVTRHDEALYGNGKAGVMTEITLIKKWIDDRDWLNKLVVGIFMAETIALVVGAVVYLIRIQP